MEMPNSSTDKQGAKAEIFHHHNPDQCLPRWRLRSPRRVRYKPWWVLGAVILLWTVACTTTTSTPQTGCNIGDLLLTPDELSPNTSISSTTQPVPDSTDDSIARVYHTASFSTGHAVFWYPSEVYSKRKYKEESFNATRPGPDGSPWSQPLNLSLNGLSADSYVIGCGDLASGPTCVFVARYKNYVIWLNSQISENALSLADFANLVTAIDRKMQACR